MTIVAVLTTTDDAGDEGDYNGSVIGSLDGIMDGGFSEEKAIKYIKLQWCDGEQEDYDNGEFDIDVTIPHPNDSDYEGMVDAGGVLYHFRQYED